MSLLGIVLLQTTPAGSEPPPDWAFSLFMLVFATFSLALLALFALFLWGAAKISGGTRRKSRSRRGGTWVAVPHDDLWIHFPNAGDARDRRGLSERGAPSEPYRADLWDEP
ncbi:hypothetical protein GBA65_22230 (plasmid) [Rubrobacter marinus]|uniref:Uncharacterized protein n=1 Tax=Rubrobacter marinus TaxID=2653852 RepID=A0A6G8Q3T1_9ACTN|nr:hypothetical protein [Rubrobacter marinus]QIN81154.1 hypothetical protein GBA65_22230 [Rubrobacter marinus]